MLYDSVDAVADSIDGLVVLSVDFVKARHVGWVQIGGDDEFVRQGIHGVNKPLVATLLHGILPFAVLLHGLVQAVRNDVDNTLLVAGCSVGYELVGFDGW